MSAGGPSGHIDWRQNSDLILGALYLTIFLTLDLRTVMDNCDYLHQGSLLVATLRILDGQVPFRDFFPWYGPLYHYLAAAVIKILGGDMLGVKLFLRAVNPVVALVMLVAAGRWFRLDWRGRSLVVGLAGAWGLALMYHCGAVRNILGLFLLAAWAAGVRGPRKNLVRALSFPAVGVVIFYSVDIGMFLLFSLAALMVIDLLQDRERRSAGLASYLAGAAAATAAVVVIRQGTEWGGNYLRFSAYTSENMMWAYGLPLPEGYQFLIQPNRLIFFLPLMASIVALAVTMVFLVRRRIGELPLVIPACGLFAGFSWSTTYIRTDLPHLIFALPPTAILMGLAFQRRTRLHWSRIALFAAAALTAPTLAPYNLPGFTDGFSGKSPITFNPRLGIYQTTEDRKIEKFFETFIATHPGKTIFMLPSSLDAFLAGLPITGPVDDLIWNGMPLRRKRIIEWLEKSRPDSICIDQDLMLNIYTAEDLDPLFDYISSNYERESRVGPLIFLRRREQPVPLSFRVEEFQPRWLEDQNRFSARFDFQQLADEQYLEFDARFVFRPTVGRRFCLPLIDVYFDGVLRQDRNHLGRKRVNTGPEGGRFRVFVPPGVSQVRVTITYPGVLNYHPERVALTDIRLQKFLIQPRVPYTMYFLVNGY